MNAITNNECHHHGGEGCRLYCSHSRYNCVYSQMAPVLNFILLVYDVAYEMTMSNAFSNFLSPLASSPPRT